jgi:Tfp pilus assembly protein PilO
LEQSGESWSLNLEVIFTLLSVILITALGAWLLFSAVRENPHEDEALKVKLRIAKFERIATRLGSRKSRFEEKLALAQEAAGALNSELQTAVEASRLELAEAAKSVYRRALINEMGDPEFTKSYYQDEGKP